MKAITAILAGTALALTAGSAASAETRVEKGEAKLARMLEGRTAGEPVNCISSIRSNDLQVIEHVGLVYEVGDTVYVARPANPNSLGTHDVVVIERFGSQLCANDVIRTVDRYAGFMTGAVFLEKFVPYKKG